MFERNGLTAVGDGMGLCWSRMDGHAGGAILSLTKGAEEGHLPYLYLAEAKLVQTTCRPVEEHVAHPY